jgi:hypothetical protein
MHDHFSELYEWDEDGRKRRKKRVARDREQFHFPMTMMDHAAFGFSPHFFDGTPDHTSPHRPGYRFADTHDAARLAAEQAYRERSTRLQDAWRKGRLDPVRDHASRQLTLDELRAAADAAYREKCERLRNGWRNR